MPFLSEFEPNRSCYIRTIEGDIVKVALVKGDGKTVDKWKTVPPYKNEEFSIKDYRYWTSTIPDA